MHKFLIFTPHLNIYWGKNHLLSDVLIFVFDWPVLAVLDEFFGKFDGFTCVFDWDWVELESELLFTPVILGFTIVEGAILWTLIRGGGAGPGPPGRFDKTLPLLDMPLFSGSIAEEFIIGCIWFPPSDKFGSLILTCSLKTKQKSPIFDISPFLPEYNVRHCRQREAYPFVRRTISPGTRSFPGSSHTDTFMQALGTKLNCITFYKLIEFNTMLPVGSPTLKVRTSRFSFVNVAWPTSSTINMTLIFFNPGRISLIDMQSFAALQS